MEIFDVSVPIRTGMVTHPGDPPVRLERWSSIADGAAAKLLVTRGVKLVGVDWLSVGDEDAHHVLLEAGVIPIEGLDLRGVEPGDYFLVAAPLKIEGSDGAPARVLLVRGVS